ncbi:MAG: DUF4197 family protein, partial [Sneathiella sp.]|nr:DUF4197 family protein [Sneathiella sp.]
MKNSRVLSLSAILVLALNVGSAEADLLKGLQDTLKKAVAPSGSSKSGSASALGISEITKGLKEALKVGTERVVGQIGAKGGYEDDPKIHIPLPKKMRQAQSFMRQFGLSAMADDVEARLNKGAEAAAPKTKELIWKVISDMT